MPEERRHHPSSLPAEWCRIGAAEQPLQQRQTRSPTNAAGGRRGRVRRQVPRRGLRTTISPSRRPACQPVRIMGRSAQSLIHHPTLAAQLTAAAEHAGRVSSQRQRRIRHALEDSSIVRPQDSFPAFRREPGRARLDVGGETSTDLRAPSKARTPRVATSLAVTSESGDVLRRQRTVVDLKVGQRALGSRDAPRDVGADIHGGPGCDLQLALIRA